MRRHPFSGSRLVPSAARCRGATRLVCRGRLVVALLVGAALPGMVGAAPMVADAGGRTSLPRSTFVQDSAPNEDIQAEHPDAPTPAEEGRYVVIRAVSFAALVALVGAVVFWQVIVPAMTTVCTPALRARVWRGVRLVGGAGAVAVVVTGLVRAMAQRAMLAAALGGDEAISYADVLAGSFGLGVALQLLGGIAGSLAFLRRAPSRRATALAWLAMVAAMAPALSGHAAGEESLVLPVVADTLHVLAAGSWAGTLAILAVVALPTALAEPPEVCGVVVLSILRRFTTVALGSAAVLLVTGVYASWIHLGSFAALWSTRYGHSLLLKLALLVGMGVLGAVNWRRMGPAAGTVQGARGLTRSARLELFFAVAIVVVTAVLVARPTPSDFLP